MNIKEFFGSFILGFIAGYEGVPLLTHFAYWCVIAVIIGMRYVT